MRRFKPSELVDFAIVGSGAAGGVMAKVLSEAGFDVVVLEQGPRLGPTDFEHDEFKYYFLDGITNSPAISPQTYRKNASQRAERNQTAVYARIVGGSSNHFTANYWRFHDIDFHERSVLGSIAGTGFTDWPITYDELEPYYTRVDWEIGVSGLAGASPFDPHRSRPYPMPPLPVKSSGVLFERGARKLGLHPFPAPMAIASEHYRGRPGCVHCGFCMGFGCEVGAKSSSLYTAIPDAEATGHCEIRPDSFVFRVETDKKHRATGVMYFDKQRKEHFQRARAVVVCAIGAETPRLLLNSASSRFPDGLANSSGVVGKYLMFNQGGEVHATFEHELNEHKSVQVTRIVHDFYDSDPKRGFYGGGGIDGRIGPQPAIWALARAPGMPTWGAEFKERLESFTRSMTCVGHTTSLPQESNNITLDPELKDAWGIPCIRTTYTDHPDDLAIAGFLLDRSVEIMEAAGARKVWKLPLWDSSYSNHLLGTCRMGNDPATSVIDRYHRTHDVSNLFLCDGSSFVTSGRGQPTMTIQALAFRAGDYIARSAKRNEI
jgi:choline dehydrogenase-like flavoprotein